MEYIIAMFQYNSKKCIIYKENNEINFGYMMDKKIIKDLTMEEYSIFNQIYTQIRSNPKKSVSCGKYKIDNKVFQIFLDITNNMYHFIMKLNNQNVIPEPEYIAYLNNYYNSHNEVLYNEEEAKDLKAKNKIPNFFKRFIKIGTGIIVVMIASGIALNTLPEQTKFEMKYNIQSYTQQELEKLNKNYTYDDIVNAIENNDNIQEKDKMFLIESFQKEFEENKEYMDIKTIIDRLKSFKTEYVKELTYNEETEEYDYTNPNKVSTVSAEYNVILNKMTLYDGADIMNPSDNYEGEIFDLDKANKSTYFHEFNHLQTIYTWGSTLDMFARGLDYLDVNFINVDLYERFSASVQSVNRNYLMEVINELFTREYFEEYCEKYGVDNGTGYDDMMPYMFGLSELLNEDTLRKYKYNDSLSIIISDLLQTDNNMEKAYELITSINSIDLYGTNKYNVEEKLGLDNAIPNTITGEYIGREPLSSEEKELLDNANKEIEENYKRIHDGFAYFYEKKYNKDMSNDMVMLLYFYNSPIQTEEEHQKVIEFLNIEKGTKLTINPKGYVSESYKEKHPYITVEYEKNGEKCVVEINDDNRYISRKKEIER